jgi:HSP20 family molecular chaperone IbpA
MRARLEDLMSLARRITPTTYVSRSDPFSLLDHWFTDLAFAPQTARAVDGASRSAPLAAPLAYDLVETDAEWLLDVAVPGLGPDDVDVDVERRSLTVRADFSRRALSRGDHAETSANAHADPNADPNAGALTADAVTDDAQAIDRVPTPTPLEARRSSGLVHQRMLPRGEVTFRYRLPASTDVEAIHARIEDGMLRVTMPKVAAAKVRSIPIHRA